MDNILLIDCGSVVSTIGLLKNDKPLIKIFSSYLDNYHQFFKKKSIYTNFDLLKKFFY